MGNYCRFESVVVSHTRRSSVVTEGSVYLFSCSACLILHEDKCVERGRFLLFQPRFVDLAPSVLSATTWSIGCGSHPLLFLQILSSRLLHLH